MFKQNVKLVAAQTEREFPKYDDDDDDESYTINAQYKANWSLSAVDASVAVSVGVFCFA